MINGPLRRAADAIIAAIRAGDQAAVTNFRNAASRFQRVIEAVGDRGIW